jgi:hypothetical protein
MMQIIHQMQSDRGRTHQRSRGLRNVRSSPLFPTLRAPGRARWSVDARCRFRARVRTRARRRRWPSGQLRAAPTEFNACSVHRLCGPSPQRWGGSLDERRRATIPDELKPSRGIVRRAPVATGSDIRARTGECLKVERRRRRGGDCGYSAGSDI